MRIDLFVHAADDSGKLDLILQKLDLIYQKEQLMAKELDDLTAQVTANTTVEGSALTLIQGLAGQLAAAIASGNPAALTALQVQLKTSADALAQAVAANTASAPPA